MNLKKIILGSEEKLNNTEVRKSADELDDLIADNFFEIGSSGKKYFKEDVINFLQLESEQKIFIEDFEMTELTDGLILANYRAVKLNPKTNVKIFSLRSSSWRLFNGKWKIVFHQGTPQS
jgi:hypothetical protein